MGDGVFGTRKGLRPIGLCVGNRQRTRPRWWGRDDKVTLELRERGHARVEDRVRCWKATGMLNPPFEDYVRNQAWTQVTLLASCLLSRTQLVCLTGDLARAEPKTLRYRIFHVAARLARRHGRLILRIDDTWPWRHDLATAFTRLRTRLC